MLRIHFFSEQQECADGRREDVGAGVERLRDGEASRRAVFRAEHGDVRIRRRFNDRQSGRQHEEREQERAKRLEHHARRDERERADGQNHEADENAFLIAHAADQFRRRKRHQQIRDEERRLDEARLRFGEREQVLEMLVQHVQHRVAKAPDEKEARHHEERKQVGIAFGLHGLIFGFDFLTANEREGTLIFYSREFASIRGLILSAFG